MQTIKRLLVAAACFALAVVSLCVAPAAQKPDAGDGEAARLARLAAIARDLQDAQSDAVALFTEAARAMGFVIWDEDRQVLAEPTGAPRLHLALTDAEIRAYALMFRSRHSVARDDLLAGIDSLHSYVGLPGAASPHALAWLRGASTGNASVRAMTLFLQDLGALRRREAGVAESVDPLAELDPLQALLIVRVLTEEIGTPLRRALARGEVTAEPKAGDRREVRRGPAVSEFGSAPADAPGWAEDSFVGGITGLFGEVAQRLGELGKKVSDGTGKANALASIAKFIATYTFLKGEVRVEAPGQPLIRTKDRDPGEQRTLVAKFMIDGARVTDWLKDNRKLVALAGLDVDMPKSGALKGVETEWQIAQSQRTTATHLIQTVRGQSDLSKVRTDENGEARIRVEGMPQPRKLDPNKVMALDKFVTISVTPQVKTTEIQQDLVDAVTGAIGIKGGPSGWLTPVMECLYRSKWKGREVLDLQVRDWQPADTIGQGTIEITAAGHDFRRDHGLSVRINRLLKLTDVHMDAMAFEPPPGLDPELVKRLPPHIREQMEAGMKAAAQAARQASFSAKGPGTAELHVHDSETWYGPEGECDPENAEGSMTRNGDVSGVYGQVPPPAYFQFYVQLDLDKNVAKLSLMGSCETDVVRTVRRSRSGSKTEQTKEQTTIFHGLTLQPPFDKGIEIPLQITPIRDGTMNNYYGVVRVPFRFGRNFTGSALVSYSVTRKVKPK